MALRRRRSLAFLPFGGFLDDGRDGTLMFTVVEGLDLERERRRFFLAMTSMTGVPDIDESDEYSKAHVSYEY
jgi:hypothetical protein